MQRISILISILFAINGVSYANETIVPKRDQISDFQTKLSIAKILSHHNETQETALELYEQLLNGKVGRFPHFDRLKKQVVDDQKKMRSDSTIVPKNAWISLFDTEWALARIYSHGEQTQEMALALYAKLLQREPGKIELYLEMGSLYIALKRFQEGLNLFYDALDRYPDHLKLLVATAQGELASGHAEASKKLFVRALNLSTATDATVISYADAMMVWGDFYQAEEIYRQALESNSSSLELHLKLAWSFLSAQRYEEAEGVYSTLLTCWPNEPKVLEAFVRLKIQEKAFDKAEELIERLLTIEPTIPKYLQLKAEILFKKRQYCEAIAVYELFTNDRKDGVHAYIGMGKAYQKLGQPDEAVIAFQAAYDSNPKNIEAQYYLTLTYSEGEPFVEDCMYGSSSPQELSELAGILIENGSPQQALFLYQMAVEIDPNYFPAWIGTAETLSILYVHHSALTIYQELLEKFPNNAKITLAIARVYAWSKQYDTSIAIYDQIIQLNPKDPVPYREKARTALWGKKFNLAMSTYDQLLVEPAGDLADVLIQESIYLEKRAKALNWNKRYFKALCAYRELLDFNPGNEEALFDYAQIYCILGLCDYSRSIYEDILNIDPSHNIVTMALERNQLKNHIGLEGRFLYWREIGSGTFSASQIARYRLDQQVEMPLTCRSHLRFIQHEYVENPFYNFKFYPAEGQTLEADCQYDRHWSGFISVTYKNYFHQFRPTVTSHNQLLYTPNDYLQILFSCNQEDEIYNIFCLRQAIQSTNSFVTLSSKLTPYWNLAGMFQYYNYNDHNDQVHINLMTEYQLMETPTILKVILQGNYRNAAHQMISIFKGTQLVDMIHPYWTPDEYFSGALTLEWRHDYRRFEFCEAPQRFVDLKITAEVDNVNNPSIEAILEWKHQFDCHWGFEIKGLIHRSPLWNAEGAWAAVSYRF